VMGIVRVDVCSATTAVMAHIAARRGTVVIVVKQKRPGS
jgi:hypothetical protein